MVFIFFLSIQVNFFIAALKKRAVRADCLEFITYSEQQHLSELKGIGAREGPPCLMSLGACNVFLFKRLTSVAGYLNLRGFSFFN